MCKHCQVLESGNAGIARRVGEVPIPLVVDRFERVRRAPAVPLSGRHHGGDVAKCVSERFRFREVSRNERDALRRQALDLAPRPSERSDLVTGADEMLDHAMADRARGSDHEDA